MMADYIRKSSRAFSRILQRHSFEQLFQLSTISLHLVLSIPRDRRIRDNLYLYGWIYLHRGAYRPEDSRAIPQGYFEAKYWLLRQTRSW